MSDNLSCAIPSCSLSQLEESGLPLGQHCNLDGGQGSLWGLWMCFQGQISSCCQAQTALLYAGLKLPAWECSLPNIIQRNENTLNSAVLCIIQDPLRLLKRDGNLPAGASTCSRYHVGFAVICNHHQHINTVPEPSQPFRYIPLPGLQQEAPVGTARTALEVWEPLMDSHILCCWGTQPFGEAVCWPGCTIAESSPPARNSPVWLSRGV